MEIALLDVTTARTVRAKTPSRFTGCFQCSLLFSPFGLPMATAAERIPGLANRLLLLSSLARRRNVSPPSMTGCVGNCESEAAKKPTRARRSLIRSRLKQMNKPPREALMRAKRSKGEGRHILVDTPLLAAQSQSFDRRCPRPRCRQSVVARNQRADAALAAYLGGRQLSRQTDNLGRRSMFMGA